MLTSKEIDTIIDINNYFDSMKIEKTFEMLMVIIKHKIAMTQIMK